MGNEHTDFITVLNDIIDFNHKVVELKGVNDSSEEITVLLDLINSEKSFYLKEGIKPLINNNLLNNLNRYWLTVEKLYNKEGKIDIEKLLRCTYDLHPSKITNKYFKDKIRLELNNHLVKINETNINKLKNVYFKIFMWIEEYVSTVLEKEKRYIFIELPLKKDSDLIIEILKKIREDTAVIILNKSKENLEIDVKDIVTFEFSNQTDKSYEEIRNEIKKQESERIEEVTTIAKQATEEIVDVLYNDGTAISIPWVYEKYGVKIKNKRSTYEELIKYWKEPAFMRNGYEMDNNNLVIPVFFTKVSGVPEIEDMYWVDYDTFKNAKDIIVKENEPLIKEKNGNVIRPIPYSLDGFNLNDIKNLKNYRYSKLREKIEVGLYNSLKYVLNKNILNLNMKDIDKVYLILDVYLNIPDEYLELLQNYDYGKTIPKLVILNTNDNELSDREAVLLSLLNQMGMDIVLMVPSGYRLLEHKFREGLIEEHKLNKFKLNLEIPEIRDNPFVINNENTNVKNDKGYISKFKKFLGL